MVLQLNSNAKVLSICKEKVNDLSVLCFRDFNRMKFYILCLFKIFIKFLHIGYIQDPGEENLQFGDVIFSEKCVISNNYRKQSRPQDIGPVIIFTSRVMGHCIFEIRTGLVLVQKVQ